MLLAEVSLPGVVGGEWLVCVEFVEYVCAAGAISDTSRA